ncbi:aminotransferase class I/II-fold pyridoxal phosphate-dependent enzyme [Shigella flexneri]
MDGVIANLKGVSIWQVDTILLVMVDDSHAVGFVGVNGRGSHEYCDVMGRVDIITGTLGKALGGASGGYTAARKEVWLSGCASVLIPYLFSNSLARPLLASIKVLEMVRAGSELRDRVGERAPVAVSKCRRRACPGGGRSCHYSGDAWRCGRSGAEIYRGFAKRGHLRHSSLLSGRSERSGAYSYRDVCRRIP